MGSEDEERVLGEGRETEEEKEEEEEEEDDDDESLAERPKRAGRGERKEKAK